MTACDLDSEGALLLERACAGFAVSARGRSRLLRVARTLADLDGRARVSASDVAEAVQFRTG